MVDGGGGGRGSTLEVGSGSCEEILSDLEEVGEDLGVRSWMWAHRLGGKGFSRRLLLAMGSKALRCSSEGPGICMEDDGSTSSESSVIPLNVEALRAA